MCAPRDGHGAVAAPGCGPGDTNGGCFVSWARGRPRATATVVRSPSCHSCRSPFILYRVLGSAVLLLGGSRLWHHPARGFQCQAVAFGPHLPLLPGWSTNEPLRGARSHPRGRGFVGGNHSPPGLLLGTASHVLPRQTLPGTTPGKTTPQGHPSDPGVPSCWGQRPPHPPTCLPAAGSGSAQHLFSPFPHPEPRRSGAKRELSSGTRGSASRCPTEGEAPQAGNKGEQREGSLGGSEPGAAPVYVSRGNA